MRPTLMLQRLFCSAEVWFNLLCSPPRNSDSESWNQYTKLHHCIYPVLQWLIHSKIFPRPTLYNSLGQSNRVMFSLQVMFIGKQYNSNPAYPWLVPWRTSNRHTVWWTSRIGQDHAGTCWGVAGPSRGEGIGQGGGQNGDRWLSGGQGRHCGDLRHRYRSIGRQCDYNRWTTTNFYIYILEIKTIINLKILVLKLGLALIK